MPARLVLGAVFAVLAATPALEGQGQPRTTARALIDQAARAEAAFRFDVATADLYEVLLEHSKDADAVDGRMPLARLLALAGNAAAGLLHCQALQDALPADHPRRRAAVDLARILARRLRLTAGGAYFPTAGIASARGVTNLDEPTAVHFERSGGYLLVDEGDKRAYRVVRDTATPIGASSDENASAAFLPDDTMIVAGKNGISIGGGKPVFLAGSWDGRTRQAKKIRSLAAMSSGDVIAIDRDFDGLLLCKAGGVSCAPWGPVGKFRTVKAGLSDFVFVLDDNKKVVRVLNRTGRQIAAIGPTAGTLKFGEIVDIAVDEAYGLYLLDKETRRIEIMALQSRADNTLGLIPLGSTVIATEGDRAMRDPSAIGIASDGSALLVGRSATRFLTLQ